MPIATQPATVSRPPASALVARGRQRRERSCLEVADLATAGARHVLDGVDTPAEVVRGRRDAAGWGGCSARRAVVVLEAAAQPAGTSAPRAAVPRPARASRVSLSRFVALDPKVVLPGHGRAFTEVDVLAARLRSHSRQRANEIETILRAGPATPFEVARRLQWQPEGARLVLGLAHAQGHLDLLEDAGRVIAEEDGAIVSYRLRACNKRSD